MKKALSFLLCIAILLTAMLIPTAAITVNNGNYLVYQESETGTAPTVDADALTISAAGTTNLISGSGELNVNSSYVDVEGIFTKTNYTGYGDTHAGRFSYSEADATVTASGVAKVMFNQDTFDGIKISSILESKHAVTGKEGYMQSGYILNMQPNTLNVHVYNSGGYVVFLRRNTTSMGKLELVLRYVDSTGTAKKTDVIWDKTDLTTTKLDYRWRLDAQTDGENIIISVYEVADDNTETWLTTQTKPLDVTATTSAAPVYNSGTFALVTNGATTFSDFSVKELKTAETDTRTFDNATNLKASGKFTLLQTPATMYAGFNFRVQKADAVTRGINGYAVKLFQKEDATDEAKGQLLLEISTYGTNTEGEDFVNLKNASINISEVLSDATTSAGAKMLLEVTVIGKVLYATVTNAEDNTKTVTKRFDLSEYAKFDDYKAGGGFGIFKYGRGAITVEALMFDGDKIGDTDRSGKVDNNDFIKFRSDMLGVADLSNDYYDITNDGIVDVRDILVLKQSIN